MSSTVSAHALRRVGPRTFGRSSARSLTTTGRLRADQVRIVEVGPRDGLQNEKNSIPVATKIELLKRLAATGLRTIEAGSFVHPKWVPQMANSSDIIEHILKDPPWSKDPITYQWLLPNTRGLEDMTKAIDSNDASESSTTSPQHEVSIFMAATETFSLKNTNCSIADSLARFAPLIASARARNLPVRAYISVALGCPFEGPNVSPTRVAELAAQLLALGAREISVADTTGMGTAPRTRELLRALTAAGVDNQHLALHFHDTYGQALVNAAEGLEHGVRVFDSAVGGLGGCPFSPGATGNVSTEDLVHFVEGAGMRTGLDLPALAQIGKWISEELGRGNESRAGKALLANAKKK